MTMILSEPELRVLGSLVEKETTTPEYYPLSLNSLMNACNQKTNREPVVSYDECKVAQAVNDLRDKGLVIVVSARDSRVPKYDNYFSDTYSLSPAESAALCVLMLRGPQTPGEIRGRAERLHEFGELSEVDAVLEGLASREAGALVVKLPRQPGRKEYRYAHLLGGDLDIEALDAGSASESGTGGCSEKARIERLEAELTALRQEFAEFKKQFE